MKMEAVDVVLGDAVEFNDGGRGDDITGGRALCQHAIVAMTDPGDHPGCLDIDKDRLVIRRAGGGEYAHDVQLQRIDAIKIKEVLRCGNDRIANAEVQSGGDVGAQNGLAQHSDLSALGHFKGAKVKVFQGCTHDPRTVRLERGIERDRQTQPGIPDDLGFRHGHRGRAVIGEIERVHDQIQLTTAAAKDQRRLLSTVRQCGLRSVQQDLADDRHRQDQRRDQHQHHRARPMVAQIGHREEHSVHAAPSDACRKVEKSMTRSNRGSSSWSWVTANSVAP